MASLIVDWYGASDTPPYKALILIPQDYDHLTLESGSAPNGVWTLDTMLFWQDIKTLEESEAGIVFNDLQSHNPPYTIAGTVYADALAMECELAFYNATPAEDWTVILDGSNNDLFDIAGGVYVPTAGTGYLTLIPGNAAGLIRTDTSGLTVSESTDLSRMRKWVTNAQRIAEGTTGNFEMWDDGDDPDVDPALETQDVTDKDGNAIVLPTGAPARRSEAT